MPIITGFINVYRSGWFHRIGKPDTYDRHGGDVYPSEHLAKQHIEPRSHYVATIPVQWYELEHVEPNVAHSEPVRLHVTRLPYLEGATQ